MIKRGIWPVLLVVVAALLSLLISSVSVSASPGDSCWEASNDVCTYGSFGGFWCWLGDFFCDCVGTSDTCAATIGSSYCSSILDNPQKTTFVGCGFSGCTYADTSCATDGCSGENWIDGYCSGGACSTSNTGCSNTCCSAGYSCQGSPATCQLSCIDNDGDGYGTDCPAGSDCNDNNALLTNNCNVCGNDVYEPANSEACDWGANNGGAGAWQHSSWISCGTYPNAEKRQRCSTGCQFEYDQDSCGSCGDGIVNGPEACEGSSITTSGCSACNQKTCDALSCIWGSCALMPGGNDDSDGYLDTSCGGTDCNDNDATKWQLLSGYTDSDSDGYGAGSVQSVCSGSSLPSGYSSVGGDCNNANANIYPGSCHADAISWPSTCATSTTGGCGSGTCTRVTNGVACGSGSRTCNAGDSKYCSGGNIYADTDTDKSCTAYCASGSCGSCTPPSCDTDLWEVCDTCSGQTSPTYFAADTVVDYGNCQAGQTSCPSTSISDVCSGSSLTEYYCSGASAASTTFDCNSYDYTCSGTCGTGVNSCVGLDYGCSGGGNGYCSPSASVDLDTSSSWCSGCGAQGTAWSLGGEVAQSTCCGDDAGEFNRFRDCKPGSCVDNPTDRRCCNADKDCVYNGECYYDVDSAIPLVQAENSAFCTGKNQNACTSGQSKVKCQWTGSNCVAAATRAAVQFSQKTGGSYKAYADVDNDGSDEVCVASSPGQWVGDTFGSVSGVVRNITSTVQGALVRVLGTSLTATTAGDGSYVITNVLTGNHDVVASKSEYEASSVYGVFVPDGGAATADFTLVRALGDCEDDCTKVGSNLCDASCHGKGLCWFYSDATKAACDGTFGLTEMPGGTQYVDCCMGRAYTPLKAQASVPSKNVVVTKRPVLYKGKFVNMVMVVFIP